MERNDHKKAFNDQDSYGGIRRDMESCDNELWLPADHKKHDDSISLLMGWIREQVKANNRQNIHGCCGAICGSKVKGQKHLFEGKLLYISLINLNL